MSNDTELAGVFIINGHDYTQYVKHKTGLSWSRENTNEADAGRDESDVMHPMVISHQRKLTVKMGGMPFSVCHQLEADLEGYNSEGEWESDSVEVVYPDLMDGVCKREFYNTSIDAAVEQFKGNEIIVDDIHFTLISISEEKEEYDPDATSEE